MAATVYTNAPAGVSFPPRHTNLGPFKVNAFTGMCFFGVNSSATGQVYPANDLDLSSLWRFTGPAKTMSSAITTPIEAMACYQVGDVIHVATQIASGAVYYNSFNTVTANWTLTTSEVAVAAASQAPVVGSTFVDLVVRSTGEVVVVYNAGQTAMSSTFNMVRYTRRTAANTFSAPVNVDNGGSVNYVFGIAALGASDRVHFFLKDLTNGDAYQRTLTSANSLQTWPASFEPWQSTAPSVTMSNALSYVDGATTRVRVPVATNESTGIVTQV